MPAWPQPGDDAETARRADEQRLILGQRVLDQTRGRPATFSEPLQLRSGKARGTGPVSQTPGWSSTGPSCSMTRPPVASYAAFIATIGLASASPEVATRREDARGDVHARERGGIARGQRLAQRDQACRCGPGGGG